MQHLPLHFDLQGRKVLLVGAGEIARRKAELLLAAGAHLRVVAKRLDVDFFKTLGSPHEILLKPYEGGSQLDEVILVVAATDDVSTNSRASENAMTRQIPVNVVDNPGLSSVIFPAIIDRSPIVMSVGTGGGSPVLTRKIREQLEALVGEGTARLGAFLTASRDQLKQRFPDIEERRRITEAFLASPGATLAEQGKFAEAEKYIEQQNMTGEVYVVGAGPGDPDLLTLKALQLMQQADVILYDNLVSDRVLARARRDASREFVGKRSGYKSTAQEDINELLVRLAKEGKRVLRLKGGDPFIFGRGGEELASLVEHKIPFQVVPGITAASGCAAYAGIPLTHRDHAQSVRFVTGHPKDGEVTLNWPEFVQLNQTTVFYMGLGGLASICRNLMKHGMSPELPVAVISKGTTAEQKIVKGTVETIGGLVARVQLQSPTLIIVGEVVNLPTSLQSQLG